MQRAFKRGLALQRRNFPIVQEIQIIRKQHFKVQATIAAATATTASDRSTPLESWFSFTCFYFLSCLY